MQIVMSANKESVMSEKAMTAGFGQTIVVGYSEPIHSRQFPTFDDFASRVQKEWDHQWKRVYSSKIEGRSLLQIKHQIFNLVNFQCLFAQTAFPGPPAASAVSFFIVPSSA